MPSGRQASSRLITPGCTFDPRAVPEANLQQCKGSDSSYLTLFGFGVELFSRTECCQALPGEVSSLGFRPIEALTVFFNGEGPGGFLLHD